MMNIREGFSSKTDLEPFEGFLAASGGLGVFLGASWGKRTGPMRIANKMITNIELGDFKMGIGLLWVASFGPICIGISSFLVFEKQDSQKRREETHIKFQCQLLQRLPHENKIVTNNMPFQLTKGAPTQVF